jgi:DNA-binding MarR family transcriptional regulator
MTVRTAPGAALESSAELADLLRLAMRRLRRGTREALAPLGLSGSEANVVRMLAAGSLRMSVIAGRLAVVPRTVTDLVDGAELAGFVTRLADPGDRRSTLVELTPAGRRLLDQLDSARRQSAARVFGALTEGQRSELLVLLREICAADEGGGSPAGASQPAIVAADAPITAGLHGRRGDGAGDAE